MHYTQGFDFELLLDAKHKGDGKCDVGFFILSKSVATWGGHTMTALSCDFLAQTERSNGEYTFNMPLVPVLLPLTGLGVSSFFKKPVSSIEELSGFIVDGHFKLRVQLIKLDGHKFS